jgi:signal transduction histidine kinase
VSLHGPEHLIVRGDAQALHSLVRNLVDNAIVHAGTTPRIEVRLDADAGSARLCVDDDGPGIPVEERERMFDRFRRREDSAAEGSGLGLAIVQAVARRHHAEVRLADSPLGGLRVEVRFAMTRPAA